MAKTANELAYPHPLVGEVVKLDPTAKPAGWDEDEPFTDHPTSGFTMITDVAVAEDGYPFGTVEASGWWWDIKDVEPY